MKYVGAAFLLVVVMVLMPVNEVVGQYYATAGAGPTSLSNGGFHYAYQQPWYGNQQPSNQFGAFTGGQVGTGNEIIYNGGGTGSGSGSIEPPNGSGFGI